MTGSGASAELRPLTSSDPASPYCKDTCSPISWRPAPSRGAKRLTNAALTLFGLDERLTAHASYEYLAGSDSSS